ncbi:MAG: D-alanyl-D-alanine carboxypeptidase family protein [Christensenellales bacterium]
MKRIVPILLALLILLLFPLNTLAAPLYEGNALKAGGIALMNADTGEVLVSGNGTGKIYPASTTKIMTCLLALEHGNLDDTLVVSARAASFSGGDNSNIALVEGERLTLRQMLYGLMLQSGNDAAVAVAEYVSGSVEEFCDLMNEKSQELGLRNTHFTNPHGRHDDDHYTTAIDMAKLTSIALQNGHFAKIVSTVTYQVGKTNKSAARSWRNSNRLVRPDNASYFEGATGVKTGTTGTALGCLVSSATRNDVTLIACVFNDGDYSGELRFPYSVSLLQFGFDNYSSYTLQDVMDEELSSRLTVQNAAQDDIQGGELSLACQYDETARFYGWTQDVQQAIEAGGAVEIRPTFDTAMVYAPISKGAVLGDGQILLNGKKIGECQLVATRAVAENPGAQPSTATQTPIDTTPADTPNLLSILFIAIAGLLILLLILRLFNKARRRKARFGSRSRRHTTARGRSCPRPHTKRRPPNRPVR